MKAQLEGSNLSWYDRHRVEDRSYSSNKQKFLVTLSIGYKYIHEKKVVPVYAKNSSLQHFLFN